MANQIRCKNCRTLNDPDRKFCAFCEVALQSDIAAPPLVDPNDPQTHISGDETPTLPSRRQEIPPLSLPNEESAHSPSTTGTEETLEKAPMSKPGLSRRQVIAILGGTATLAAVGAGALIVPSIISNVNQLPPITIHFSYGSDKDQWLQAAIQSFHDAGHDQYQGHPIVIDLDSRSALDVISKIMSGDLTPTLWSPASSITLDQLNEQWKAKNGKEIISSGGGRYVPKSVVITPTVFGMWKSRAQVFLNHYTHIDWTTIQDAVTQKGGWGDIGGEASWGPVKLGQTRPDLASSGIVALIMIAYSYYNAQRNLTLDQIHDPQFQSYLNSIEDAVTQYGRSTGTFLETVVAQLGPAGFDIIFTEENLLLADNPTVSHIAGEMLQIFYPNPVFVLDHPFAILQAPWVKSQEKEAALVFLNYLSSIEAQQQALQFGYRPTNPSVTIQDHVPDNLFLKSLPNMKVQSDYGSIAKTPDLSVIEELIKIWQTANPDPVTAAG